ncbi:MAG: hypothetical protein H7330_09635 [Hymenobacteraceae bacterium]|nr:hypothetical protein [Hymenobacteraceae bacterium]
MKHKTTAGFWRRYAALTVEVQRLADKGYALMKVNSGHPSLHFKPVGQVWSARVGLYYRALALREGDTVTWFWIGHHSEYDKLLARR